MASDIHSLLAETLDDRAGGDVDPAPLMRGAMAKGRRIHRRRMLTGAAAMVAAMAVIGGVAVTSPGSPPDSAPADAPPSILLSSRPPMLPTATGQEGAAARPDLIGTDPRVLHFSMDALSGTATTVTWTSEAGSERIELSATDFEAHVAVARTPDMLGASISFMPRAGGFGKPAPVRIAGRAGTLSLADTPRADGLGLWSLRWQPATGVWAQADVWARVRADVELVAGLVRFDVAQRCALPFTLTSLPSGMPVRSCTVTLSLDRGVRFDRGTLDVGHNRRRVSVLGAAAPTVEPFTVGLPAGPYRVRRDDERYTTIAPPYLVEATVVTPKASVTQAEVLRLVAGLRTRGEPTDPRSW